MTEVTDALRQQVFDVLLEHIENDNYPSVSMMECIEASVSGDEERLARYVAALTDKIATDTYPSLPMIRRVLRLTR